MQDLINKVQNFFDKKNQIKNPVLTDVSFDDWVTSIEIVDVIEGFKSIDLDLTNASEHTVNYNNEVVNALENLLASIKKDNETISKNNKSWIDQHNKEKEDLCAEVAETGILDYSYKVRLPINLYNEGLVTATKMPFDVNEERVLVFLKDKDSAEQLRSALIDKFNESNPNSKPVKNKKGLINISEIHLSFLTDFLKIAKITNPQW